MTPIEKRSTLGWPNRGYTAWAQRTPKRNCWCNLPARRSGADQANLKTASDAELYEVAPVRSTQREGFFREGAVLRVKQQIMPQPGARAGSPGGSLYSVADACGHPTRDLSQRECGAGPRQPLGDEFCAHTGGRTAGGNGMAFHGRANIGKFWAIVLDKLVQ